MLLSPYPPPTPPHPPCHPSHVHKSVHNVCVSIAALQIGFVVPSFYIPYICISIRYLSFSFWLTSLCMIGSRFIHLIGTEEHSESESEVAQSCPTLCDPWTVAHQAPPSMGFSRQEYWSGVPFPSPGDLPDPGIEPRSPTLQADALTSAPPGKLKMCSFYGWVIFHHIHVPQLLYPFIHVVYHEALSRNSPLIWM